MPVKPSQFKRTTVKDRTLVAVMRDYQRTATWAEQVKGFVDEELDFTAYCANVHGDAVEVDVCRQTIHARTNSNMGTVEKWWKDKDKKVKQRHRSDRKKS